MTEDGAESVERDHRSPLTCAAMDPENNEYATPPEIWRPLSRAVGGFDLDPASGAESTPIAPERFTKEDDGLTQPWHGDVFLNPPWSTNGDASAKEDWLRKVRNEVSRDAVDTVVVLLPSDTSTQWFHEHVMAATAVCFVGPGRIAFEGGDRNPSFGLIVATYGPVSDDLADALDTLGAVVRGREAYTPHEQRRLVTDGGRVEHDSGAPREEYGDLIGKRFKLGPSPEPTWKYELARRVFWLTYLSPVKDYVRKLPGAKRLTLWSFDIVLGSRPAWEVGPNAE